jgi:hypothetical protein
MQEASIMIIVDGTDGDGCLAQLAADVLQRAGYSVWTYWNPCLEGTYVHLSAEIDRATRTLSLHGGTFLAGDISASRTVEPLEIEQSLTRLDVQLLVASMLESPGFRRLVGHISATESANYFVTRPIDAAQIQAACAQHRPIPAAQR